MKKRIVALLMVLCLVIGLFPAVSATGNIASGTCGVNLTWELNEKGTLTISGEGMMDNYSGGGPHPPWRDVRGTIESVIIATGVTSIGNSAFRECYNLKKVNLPNTLESIGYNAFDWCTDLTDITLPSSLKTIEAYAFRDCDSLTSISIPSKVTIIDDETFMGCNNLKSVILPNGLTTIGYYAFGLSGLEEINIPTTATHIDSRAFHWTPWEDNLDGGYIIVGDHVLIGYYDDNTYLNGTAIIPEGVKYIAPNAFGYDWMEDVYFGNVKKIIDIVLPDSLLEIGYWAFDNQQFDTINIPANVRRIDWDAFSECTNLKTVYFEGNAPAMDDEIFYDKVITAYYPKDNPSWTEDVLKDYEGSVTWIPYNALNFSDVEKGTFFHYPVLWAVGNNITTGASENSFNPDGKCLRAQVVTFLHRAKENPEPASTRNPFSDVKSSDFFYKPVLWAVEKGITNGVSGTKFGSYDVCNRAAVVTFLWRAAGSPEPESTSHPFTDVKPGDFFYKPVLWAVEKGITNGVDATHFGPTTDCNRAQVVTFLYRAYN